MKIAIPVSEGKLFGHFGGASEFWIGEIDSEKKTILKSEALTPPEHAPGVYPAWLRSLGVSIVIAGGMGGRAKELFREAKIDLITGTPP